MARYHIFVSFDSDRDLTDAELGDIESGIHLQVNEPVYFSGDNAAFGTDNIKITSFRSE